MSNPVTIRTRKFMKNNLLQRRQFIVDVIHPGRANVSRTELAAELAKTHKTDTKLCILYGFRNKFGGGRSSGFCLIYDNEKALKKYTPKYLAARHGFAEKKTTSRKQIKEAKNRSLKVRGTGACIAKHKAKRAAAE